MKKNTDKKISKAVIYTALLFLFIIPELAFASATTNPILNGLNWLRDLLNNTLATSVAIVAITILGYMAFAGRLAGDLVMRWIIGIVFIFGGARIVSMVTGAL